MKTLSLFFASLIIVLNAHAQGEGVVTDPTGSHYNTITVGSQTWTAENLHYDPDALRDGIRCFNENFARCETYGKLYDFQTAMKVCQELGPGWHLPSEGEFKALANQYGGYSEKILQTDNQGDRYWDRSFTGNPSYAFEALKEGGYSRFNALQASTCSKDDSRNSGAYGQMVRDLPENRGIFWVYREYNGYLYPYSVQIHPDMGGIVFGGLKGIDRMMLSVRCVTNAESQNQMLANEHSENPSRGQSWTRNEEKPQQVIAYGIVLDRGAPVLQNPELLADRSNELPPLAPNERVDIFEYKQSERPDVYFYKIGYGSGFAWTLSNYIDAYASR